MNCEFVQNLLYDYILNNLSEEDVKKFDEHISKCEKCQKDLENYKNYFDLLKKLEPDFVPPDYLLEKISDGLMGIGKEGSEKVADRKDIDDTIKKALKISHQQTDSVSLPAKGSMSNLKATIRKFFWVILFFLGVASAGTLLYLNIDFSNEPWIILKSNGKYLINGAVSKSTELFNNDVFLTGDKTTSEINIPKMCNMYLSPNSQIVIEKTEEKNSVVNFIRGNIDVKTYSSHPYFSIESDLFKLIDNHAWYYISIDLDKNLKMGVKDGIVEVIYNNIKMPISRGYILEVRKGYDPGVPYRTNAPQKLIEELNKYLFDSGGLESLQNLLSASTEADAVTLWNLLNRVDKNEILMIYDKLNSFYPVPEGVSKRLVLSLKQDVLDKWWSEIEWQI